MSNIKAFLKGNAAVTPTIEVVVSDRFIDETGKPIKWKVRALPAQVAQELSKKYQKQLSDGTITTDMQGLGAELTAKSVVYPDLSDAELQDSYGAMGEAALLSSMLTTQEFGTLSEAINKKLAAPTMNDLIDEAKN